MDSGKRALWSAHEKALHAIDLMEELGQSEQEWRATSHFEGTIYLDDENSEIFALDPRTIPKRWALLFADALHNARSALDHAAFVYVERDDPQHSRNSSWPILEPDIDPNANKVKKLREKLKGARQSFVDYVESQQPYNDQHGSASHLNLLKDLDNTEKHRLAQPATSLLLPLQMVPLSDGTFFNVPVYPDRPALFPELEIQNTAFSFADDANVSGPLRAARLPNELWRFPVSPLPTQHIRLLSAPNPWVVFGEVDHPVDMQRALSICMLVLEIVETLAERWDLD
jgi:hypothetical protein